MTPVLTLFLDAYPGQNNGFAASILGALVALGILVVVMIFISSKPKNRRPPDH